MPLSCIKMFCLLSLLTNIVYSNIQQEKLLLPQAPLLKFHDNSIIKFKAGALEKLIQVWQKRLNNTWKKICSQLEEEAGLNLEQINEYLNDKSLHKLYMSLKEKELQNPEKSFIHEQDIHPEVLSFIKRTVQKYCSKKNIKIILTPHIHTITATVGCDQDTHYILCHSGIYTLENVKQFYNSLTSGTGTFLINTLKNDSKIIELANLLLVGLVESATHAQHQSNLFTFLLANFKFSEKKISMSLVTLLWRFTEIRGMLESLLQSKNPIETAIFIAKSKSKFKAERKIWTKLVNELADCYHPQSLAKYKQLLKKIKSTQN